MNRHKRRRTVLRAALLCVTFLAIMLVGLRLIDRWQAERFQEKPDSGTEAFMASGLVEWEGAQYKKVPAVTTLLIAGIDKTDGELEGVGTSRYRAGGQADFLMLLAIDHTNRRIHRLQIDRDAMVDVTVLSVYGQETGERLMQVCLSHSYGANREDNARSTVKAVRRLMDDLEIDGYYMVDYSAVSVLNDALGGVTVTVPDDMTAVNPLWQAGSSVTLQGSEAEAFVRARMAVGEGTNVERMRRQGEFMENAIRLLQERVKQDSGFGLRLLSSLSASAATNFSDQQLAVEIQNSNTYEVLPLEYLEGEYRHGDTGYREFYVAEGSAEEWIMNHLYRKT